MTTFRVERFEFARELIVRLPEQDRRYANWPVVYILDGEEKVYVGESLNVVARLRQHLESPSKAALDRTMVVLDRTFNKSVCLDLESYLIRLLSGDGRYQVLNGNEGITDADYYGRDAYRETFEEIFEALRGSDVFTRSRRDIVNDDLFKLSPFKALTPDQATAVEDILDGLFEDLRTGSSSRIVIQGEPGTGKTVVAIYLMKLLSDIVAANVRPPVDEIAGDSPLSEFFLEGYRDLVEGFRFGLVVPQQSLRTSIKRVFKQTPGLDANMVLTPFQVGASKEGFDLLIVDETHRLNQRANQSSGIRNRQFGDINRALFGTDDPELTQLDWVEQQSTHQLFLVDAAQAVRPADLPLRAIETLTRDAELQDRRYPLTSQMRVGAGSDYVSYVRSVLSPNPPVPRQFDGYDLRHFEDLGAMRAAIRQRDDEVGLARLVAGYAWPWRSRNDKTAYDLEFDGVQLRWNSAEVDWVNSPNAPDEVGSIHTIQGYDLNYAGVIVGNDLRFDPITRQLRFDRSEYFDTKGMENNRKRNLTYSDDDVLTFVRNIYAVFLTRGMLGTYIYVCDPPLRAYLKQFFR